jgi:hypothetical protein
MPNAMAAHRLWQADKKSSAGGGRRCCVFCLCGQDGLFASLNSPGELDAHLVRPVQVGGFCLPEEAKPVQNLPFHLFGDVLKSAWAPPPQA